ncbi:MAG: hypothetical protein U5K77_00200 [Candidatus Saccharibacteria bacterium]|nr:hypothetical protein [Candidatus Saccharibacteria bacterium]
MNDDKTKQVIEHLDDKFASMLDTIDTRIEIKVRQIVQEELTELNETIKATYIEILAPLGSRWCDE